MVRLKTVEKIWGTAGTQPYQLERWCGQENPASKLEIPNGDFQLGVHWEKGRISKRRVQPEISQWKHLVSLMPIPHAKAVVFPMPFPNGKYPHENNFNSQ